MNFEHHSFAWPLAVNQLKLFDIRPDQSSESPASVGTLARKIEDVHGRRPQNGTDHNSTKVQIWIHLIWFWVIEPSLAGVIGAVIVNWVISWKPNN
jgi:hypothetical protein